MFRKIPNYLYAKYRAFAPISCFQSPRADVLRGFRRWRWLVNQRKTDRMIDPSVCLQGIFTDLEKRLCLGREVHLDQGVIVWLGDVNGSIQLGERVYVGPYAFLGTSSHRLSVGADTMIGSHAYVITENHVTTRRDIPYAKQGYTGADIVIGANVWIGCHVTILPGVSIGDGAIIGAGAVVTKNIPVGETWAGVPARKLEKR